MSNKFGIIVDGQGDFAALKARFKNNCRVLKTDGPRGHKVTTKQIAVSSKKQCKILEAFKCDKIIVLVDFEGRRISYKKFMEELEKYFSKFDSNVNIQPCSPNIMIENWYLADVEQISKKKAFIRDRIKQKNFEGKHGKKELKKLIKKGLKYNEVKHGPQLFLSISFPVARKNSPSFDHFLSAFA